MQDPFDQNFKLFTVETTLITDLIIKLFIPRACIGLMKLMNLQLYQNEI
jgi:hypothetical protein